MDAVEGLGTTVLAAVTTETAETLLVESDCSTGDEQKKKKGRGQQRRKNQINIFRSKTLFFAAQSSGMNSLLQFLLPLL